MATTMTKNLNLTTAKDLWDRVRDLAGLDDITMEQCRSAMHARGLTRYESLTAEQVGVIADDAADLALVVRARKEG